jgi:hypothetical protein
MAASVSISANNAVSSGSKCRARQRAVTMTISTYDLAEANYFQATRGQMCNSRAKAVRFANSIQFQ